MSIVGAHLFFHGDIAIGALVDFQMLTNRLSNPPIQRIGSAAAGRDAEPGSALVRPTAA